MIRMHQWYKNLLIFLPLIFVQELFSYPSFLRVFLGFTVLCAISSSGYILNDIIDRKRDQHHPEKKKRAIASGKVSLPLAIILSACLFTTGIVTAFFLNTWFLLLSLTMFALTLWYSIYLKQIPFLDVSIIASNFVIRAVSGAFLIYPGEVVRISPWLILVPFFLAFFLVIAKRRATLLYLSSPEKFSSVFKKYTENSTFVLFSISTSLLIAVYALFTVFSDFPLLVITLPIVVYAIMYFFQKVEEGDRIGRELSHAFLDPSLMISLAVLIVLVFAIIYGSFLL